MRGLNPDFYIRFLAQRQNFPIMHNSLSSSFLSYLKADGHHTCWTCKYYAPLQNSWLYARFAITVWPLGGVKRISLTLDFSLIFDDVGTIFFTVW